MEAMAACREGLGRVEGLFIGPWNPVAAQNANVGSYKTEGFVEVLAASQTPRSTEWFQGTADAVRQYIWLFEEAMRNGVEDLLILSGKPYLRP